MYALVAYYSNSTATRQRAEGPRARVLISTGVLSLIMGNASESNLTSSPKANPKYINRGRHVRKRRRKVKAKQGKPNWKRQILLEDESDS